VDQFGDIRVAMEGDGCPRCDETLVESRGIEVGHIFMLGTKYSKSMKATFLDADGNERPFVMGSYGIGIGRTAAAAIEQNHDERGIIWPKPLTPLHVYVLPVNIKNKELADAALNLHNDLEAAGFKVLLDDRDERAGVKFADADLLGIPLRITVGPKHLSQGRVEFKPRRSNEIEIVPLEKAVDKVRNFYMEEN
jgi:prolyl-tRNA synthetase